MAPIFKQSKKMGVVNFRKRELRFDVEEFPVYQNPEFN
jgi:hypothetical protein